MGQYFKAVNLDKREYVCPWCIGGGAKLWEWAANAYGAVFTLLLRKSSGSGGGDYYGYRTQDIHLPEGGNPAESLAKAIRATASLEGRPVCPDPDTTVGRWAGDRVALVGDYDESKLWDELPTYRNISAEVVRDWNAFIAIPKMRLTHNPECSCSKHS